MNANNDTMIKTLKKRAMIRSIISYIFLSLGVIVIGCGVVLIVMQLQDMKNSKDNDIYNIISKLSFIVLVTFIAQTLLRLYKYNMLKADYFLACSDALSLRTEIKTEDERKVLEGLISLLFAEKITLTTPASPKIPFLTATKKEDKKPE